MHCMAAAHGHRHRGRSRHRRGAGTVLLLDFLLAYVLGFGFGWAFFQAFAMRDMAGGSYLLSLRTASLLKLLSMNLLMTGMVLTSRFAMKKR